MPQDGYHWMDDEAGPVVRPYALTRGRTRSDQGNLDILAQIVATGRQSGGQSLSAESRAIIDYCRTPLSLAEISAYLDLPIGVVRVLIGDLVRTGLATARQPAATQDVPDIRTLQKVIHGLRAI